VSTRTAVSRPTIIFVAIAALALSMLYLISPVSADAGYTPGTHGKPTAPGPNSDLKGGTATFTFQQNAVLSCNGDTATSFSFHIDYTVTGAALPAGATLVVYLSPNQGAINNNAGGDAAGYIADVESNYFVKDVSGLSGSGSFDVTVTVSTSFDLSGGGVLGVFASEAGATGQSWDSKSNSVQCSEAQSVPPSAEQSVKASVSASVPASVAASVPASAEGSVKAGTGTPAASTSNTALFGDGSNPLATIAFSLILLASLGALAFANVKTVRRRI
jgi:hypothetical protein